jgi:cytochrome c553
MIKVLTLGALLATSVIYAASTAGCTGCHGKNFEKKRLVSLKL